jgi:hypothetical protein
MFYEMQNMIHTHVALVVTHPKDATRPSNLTSWILADCSAGLQRSSQSVIGATGHLAATIVTSVVHTQIAHCEYIMTTPFQPFRGQSTIQQPPANVYLRLKLLFTLLPDAVPHICSCLARLYIVPFTPVCEPRFLALAAVRRWLTSPPSPTSTTPLRLSGILFLSPTLKLLSSLPRCFCANMLCYLLALPCVS